MSFAEELRAWRGKRLQKQAADVLAVPLDTYRSWEHGQNEPRETAPKSEILRRMKSHPE
jgi:DNA-binding transcriptional regulator YiaG